MARTTDEIVTTMDEEQASQPDLSDLNSASNTSIVKLWKYIVAQCQSILENLWDRKQAEIESILANGVAPTAYWIRSKTFEFQYDATTPQIIQLVDLVPTYVPVDETKRIVTICNTKAVNNIVYLKVAKDSPPVKLSAPEEAALLAYWANTGDGTTKGYGIGYGGCIIQITNVDPDLVYLKATIKYNGQYNATIQADVTAALNTYLTSLPITSTFRIVDLIDSLQGVQGFNNIFINDLSIRKASVAWGGGTALVTADTTLLDQLEVFAGHAIGETTATFTWADKLTFTAV